MDDKCILWTGLTAYNGYGKAYVGMGKYVGAHRHAWITAHGTIPDGMCVCHHCDVRACINVNHLYLGTPKDNARDRDERGRANTVRGSSHALAKLTERDVLEIRARADARETYASIAVRFGVTRENIGSVVNRKTWKHVE